MLNTKTNNSAGRKCSETTRAYPGCYKRSLTTYESLDLSDKLDHSDKMMSEPNANANGSHWFNTVSLIKSLSYNNGKKKNKKLSNHLVSDFIDEKPNKLDFYDDDNFSNSDNLNLLKSDSYSSDLPIEK